MLTAVQDIWSSFLILAQWRKVQLSINFLISFLFSFPSFLYSALGPVWPRQFDRVMVELARSHGLGRDDGKTGHRWGPASFQGRVRFNQPGSSHLPRLLKIYGLFTTKPPHSYFTINRMLLRNTTTLSIISLRNQRWNTYNG